MGLNILPALFVMAVLLGACSNKPETGEAVDAQPDNRNMTRISVEDARIRAPFKVFEPTYLPAGARHLETRYIEFDGQVFVVLQYEFEGQERYFQVDEYSPAVPESELPGTQAVQVGGHDGQALFQHGLSVVRWTQDGTRLMLNGAIGEAEALKVARSFK